MSWSPEEIHKKTDAIYRSISEQFNPNLKTFLMAGKLYERALSGVSHAARQYSDAMNKLGMIASESISTKQLGDSMRHMAEMMRMIQMHHDETLKFLDQEILFPLENKLESDQRYVFTAHKKYQNDFRLRTEDLDRMSANHKKMKRKSYNGKKPYRYDEKEKQLAEALVQRQKSLGQFQHEHLEQAFIEERRRCCFFVEQQCELVKRSIAYHQKALETLSNQLPQWKDSCADVRTMPEDAAIILEHTKPGDGYFMQPIPEPPSGPASQVHGFDAASLPAATYSSMPFMNSNSYIQATEPEARPVDSTGRNVLPRGNRKRVTAVFSHTMAGSDNQLSFEKGDVIVLMIPQPRDGWHYGENDRTKQRGWFPYSYTKLEVHNSPEKPTEPIHGHMPLPPADYRTMAAQQQQNGNGIGYAAAQQAGRGRLGRFGSSNYGAVVH